MILLECVHSTNNLSSDLRWYLYRIIHVSVSILLSWVPKTNVSISFNLRSMCEKRNTQNVSHHEHHTVHRYTETSKITKTAVITYNMISTTFSFLKLKWKKKYVCFCVHFFSETTINNRDNSLNICIKTF